MLKENTIIDEARLKLASLLKPVPFINRDKIKSNKIKNDEFLWGTVITASRRIDFTTTIFVGAEKIKLLCVVKKNLQPRFVLDAIREAKELCSYLSGESIYPVVVSEYISPRSAEVLISQGTSYFDLTGNCRLSFANVYIEKSGGKPKGSEQRGIKSLFGLKSSRMLRLMLSKPIYSISGEPNDWPIKHLAAEAKLSYGQVSNIRRALLDQDYALELEEGGFHLSKPNEFLNEWQKLYKKRIVKQASGYYSLLNVEERQEATKAAIKEAETKGAGIMLSGLSAARWLAPFAKSVSEQFYADELGLEILKKHLMLEAVSMGPNVIIEEPKDSFVFKEAVKCAPGLKCTSAIQTYLDLYIAGEREREAAEHIRNNIISIKWEGSI